jgi:PAS domain S-box-containing protein
MAGSIIGRLRAKTPSQQRWAIIAAATGAIAAVALLIGIADLPDKQREAALLADRTLEILDAADALDGDLEIAISEGRSYLLTANPARETEVETAIGGLGGDLEALRSLVSDNAVQKQAADHLDDLIKSRIALLRIVMAIRDSGDMAALQQHLTGHAARDLTVAIRADIEAIRAEVRRKLPLERQAAEAATRHTMAGLVASGMVAAVGALIALALLAGRRRERLALAELRRTEALLSTILETAPGPIYAKDLQGRNILANTAVLNVLGKPFSAVVGRTDREILDDPAEAETIMANDRRVMAQGTTQIVEEQIGTREAPQVWLSTKTPLRDAEGVIAGVVGMSIDITERKRSEKRLLAFNAELEASVAERTTALAASEARQRAYFDHSPLGMVVMRVRDDGEFVLEALNTAARTAFGFSEESAPGLTQGQLWPEFVARDKQKKMQACASRREVVEYSVAREIGGRTRHLDVVMAPLLDDGIEAEFVLICVHDVTEQRALERQVVEQAERAAEAAEREMAVFRNSPDELFVIRVEDEPGGAAFVFEAFSPSLETITGLRPADLVGRRPEECFEPAVAQSMVSMYRRCAARQDTIRFTVSRALPIGLRDFDISLSPVRNPGTGRIVRLVGAARDVTERNRTEAALRQGQKMEAIGLLAAGVAHDFDNILQAIIGGLDLVIDELAPGTPARQFADVALGSAMRGSQLTHHLLSYAKKQMLWPQAIDLAAFLPDLRIMLERTLGPHIAIELAVAGTPKALADPGELQTALLNLAINAAHAMPKSGTLRIDAREQSDAGRPCVRIGVSDTGAGMDAATLARAVEPFFTTKSVGGTGLGLSMVQGFAEQSGGTLTITSTRGQGTAVALRLPAAVAASAPEPTDPAAGRRASGRVLLVDDSTDVLVTVGAFLQKSGFEVVRADSGEAALTVLTGNQRFDVLVSDYAMPGLNGAELVAECRLIQPHLPALIITGFAAIGAAHAGPEGVEVLHKPFDRHALIDTLLRVMDGAASRQLEAASAQRA